MQIRRRYYEPCKLWDLNLQGFPTLPARTFGNVRYSTRSDDDSQGRNPGIQDTFVKGWILRSRTGSVVVTSADLAQVEQSAHQLYKAERVLMTGGDSASSLVWFLQYNLRILGLIHPRNQLWRDHSFNPRCRAA